MPPAAQIRNEARKGIHLLYEACGLGLMLRLRVSPRFSRESEEEKYPRIEGEAEQEKYPQFAAASFVWSGIFHGHFI